MGESRLILEPASIMDISIPLNIRTTMAAMRMHMIMEQGHMSTSITAMLTPMNMITVMDMITHITAMRITTVTHIAMQRAVMLTQVIRMSMVRGRLKHC
jgi:hypothetical protein